MEERKGENGQQQCVHEARGRGGKGQDIGEKSTVSARQHVWVRTPSVRLAIFSDVKRRSDPDPDEQYWGDSFGSAPNPFVHHKGQRRADVQGLYKMRGQKSWI